MTSTSNNNSKFLTGVTLYVLTGILQPTLIDALKMHGLLGRPSLLLPTLANTTGMALCGALTTEKQRLDFWCGYLLPFYKHFFGKDGNGGGGGGGRYDPVSVSEDNLQSNNHQRLHAVKFVKRLLLTASIDLLSGMSLTYGLYYTGGAIFVILYNSCPIWTALLSKLCMGKNYRPLKTMSLVGVVLVSIGLIYNVLGPSLFEERDSATAASMTSNSSQVFMGSIIVLIGSLLHSLMFVMSDLSLRPPPTQQNDKTSVETVSSDGHEPTTPPIPSALLWSCCLGSIEASLMTIWVILNILLYGFHPDDTDSDMEHPPTIPKFVTGFLLLLLVDTIHAASFFALLQQMGAVASALLKGVQTLAVVLLSALLFCPSHSSTALEGGGEEHLSQCLDWNKFVSMTFVSVGIICYGMGSSASS